MLKMIRQFVKSDFKTKNFIAISFIYLIVLVGTTIFCYARLDSVRSGPSVMPISSTLP